MYNSIIKPNKNYLEENRISQLVFLTLNSCKIRLHPSIRTASSSCAFSIFPSLYFTHTARMSESQHRNARHSFTHAVMPSATALKRYENSQSSIAKSNCSASNPTWIAIIAYWLHNWQATFIARRARILPGKQHTRRLLNWANTECELDQSIDYGATVERIHLRCGGLIRDHQACQAIELSRSHPTSISNRWRLI